MKPANSWPSTTPYSRVNTGILLAIAAAVAILHLLTNNRYGFHRDEFQFLSDARHLDWGFVAYPPLTPLLEHISLSLFGVSMVGLRLFSVIAQSAAIVVSGLMARALGGQRLAQVTAALAVALSPLPLFEGTEFQYSTFDYLWWVLAAYFVVRLLKSQNHRLWLAIGLVLGLGLQTKYTVLFLITGILGALLLTPARRYFLNRWFWAGVALAIAIFMPNFLWQIRHDFISWHFLQHIHTRDIGEGRANGFLSDQFLICANLFAAPIWLVGLIAFLRDRRYRPMAWMYLIPLLLFWVGKGRGYYLAAAYPMLLAMGATAGERWILSFSTLWRRSTEVVFFTGLAVCGLYICAILIPVASSGPLHDFALARNGDLREELGWDVMLGTIAQVRDSLPPDQQAGVGILVGNYGEQGAIEILGTSHYHLPPPISGTNSAWLRGYPQPTPSTLIVVGLSRRFADRQLTNCRLAATVPYAQDQNNEESRSHTEIYVCGPPRQPWPQFWTDFQSFG